MPQVSIVWVYQPKVQGMMQLTMLSEIPPLLFLSWKLELSPASNLIWCFMCFESLFL